MTLTNDFNLIDGDDEMSQQQFNDLLMNWALLSMDENPSGSPIDSFNNLFNNQSALNQKARND